MTIDDQIVNRIRAEVESGRAVRLQDATFLLCQIDALRMGFAECVLLLRRAYNVLDVVAPNEDVKDELYDWCTNSTFAMKVIVEDNRRAQVARLAEVEP